MNTRYAVSMLVVVSLTTICGCGTGSSERAPAGRSNVLDQQEIASVGARNMYEAIEQLRPRWLMVRGGMRSFQTETPILVYQGNMRLGTVEVLRQIMPDMVLKAEYVDGTKAMVTLPGIGTGHVAGAIIITPITKHE